MLVHRLQRQTKKLLAETRKQGLKQPRREQEAAHRSFSHIFPNYYSLFRSLKLLHYFLMMLLGTVGIGLNFGSVLQKNY
jgi:hypothetical protein